MKKIISTILFLLPIAVMLAGCTREREHLSLGGETDLLALTLDNEYHGVIDRVAGKVTVAIPSDYDASGMVVTGLEISDGAVADMSAGDILNMDFPHTMTVTSGNVFSDYTVTAKRDKAEILSFVLDGQYTGSIDGNVINVFVPFDADVTAMGIAYTVPEGTVVDIPTGHFTI